MGGRDSGYKLENIVEVDDSYFGGPDKGNKRGRGTNKTKVLVQLSVNEEGIRSMRK
jgi:hypothetical protein